jgi:hypothetical protein
MNLIISPAGDKSLHKEWLTDKPNFDLVIDDKAKRIEDL